MSPTDVALPAMDHPGRLRSVRAAVADQGLDALVVTNLANVRYLCGFTGSNGVLLVGADQAVLVTDGRYRVQAAREVAEAAVEVELRVETADLDGALAAAAAGAPRVGLEAAAVTWDAQRRYAERLVGSELVPTTNLVELRRAVKDAGEVARIERAAQIADAALAQCVAQLHEAPTEREFALILEVTMRRLGADGPSFETIVASGPNGALPHARPGTRRIERGDLVVLDFGALVAGYHSDMTRTVCVGPASAEQRRLYEVVADAQATARAAVRPGVATKQIDATARQVIEAAGWGEQFSHGTGHGIGLQVHEYPIMSRTTQGEVQEGFVVTVEPGVYLPALGGVRVEDTVVVDATGCRSLTRFPKELEI